MGEIKCCVPKKHLSDPFVTVVLLHGDWRMGNNTHVHLERAWKCPIALSYEFSSSQATYVIHAPISWGQISSVNETFCKANVSQLRKDVLKFHQYITCVASNWKTIYFPGRGNRSHRYMVALIPLFTICPLASMLDSSHSHQREKRCWGTDEEIRQLSNCLTQDWESRVSHFVASCTQPHEFSFHTLST